MSADEVETPTLVGELSDAELEVIVAGKSGGPLMSAYNVATRVGLAASRATGGGLTGFRGFGN